MVDNFLKLLHPRRHDHGRRQTFSGPHKSAFKLRIDSRDTIGINRSSARYTERHRRDDMVGRQVIAVVNFPPRQIGPMCSKVLTWACQKRTAMSSCCARIRACRTEDGSIGGVNFQPSGTGLAFDIVRDARFKLRQHRWPVARVRFDRTRQIKGCGGTSRRAPHGERTRWPDRSAYSGIITSFSVPTACSTRCGTWPARIMAA